MTRFLGCLDLIKPEVDLVRTILRTSSRLEGHWELADTGECDAILVYNADQGFLPFLLKPTTELISIRRRGDQYQGHVFLKPFRADELIDTLISIETGMHAKPKLSAVVNNSASLNFFRLKKWPPADVLRQDKAYLLLAGYLSRGAKSFQDLVMLSGKEAEVCHNFLHILRERDLLYVDAGRPLRDTNTEAVTAEIKSEKQGFLSLLRTKLGLRK